MTLCCDSESLFGCISHMYNPLKHKYDQDHREKFQVTQEGSQQAPEQKEQKACRDLRNIHLQSVETNSSKYRNLPEKHVDNEFLRQ
mmetsp:Transcript_1126/g.2834  ORF Transcript_1126/g.2834 Transcript_1126/m.2834 type:complete len:86 (-) Transcript_1126:229-486(-)